MSPHHLFRKEPSDDLWLQSALKALRSPRHLRERNILQLLLAERYQRNFGGTKLAALERIAPLFNDHFPH